MGLDLGRVPFRAGHKPYTAARQERRLRRRELYGTLAGKRSFDSLKQAPVQPNADDELSRIAKLSILPDTFAPKDVLFQVGATRDRLGGSFAASLGSHVVGFGLLAILIYFAPEPVIRMIEQNRNNYDGIIWIPEEGPGGGGGGGGNESLEIPRPVELPGEDELTVPVVPEPEFVEPEIEPEPVDLSELNIPVVSMAAALETLPGSMDAIDAERDSLSQGAGSGGGAGTGTGTGIGPGEGSGLGPGTGGGVGGGVYRPGSGIQNPVAVYEAQPQYTAAAMRAQIQGEAWVDVVILPDGTVGEVTIARSLDRVFGLDEEAIKCARQWRFKPATRFGEPVPILVRIAISFNLR